MLKRLLYWMHVMTALLLSVLICSCAGKTIVDQNRAADSLAALSREMPETDRMVATVQVDLTTAGGRYPGRFALILQKPSYLRLEMLPVIGTPDLFLTATPRKLKVFIPSQSAFYVGKPSAENLERFLSWALNIEDMVMILSGGYPSLTGKNVSYENYVEGALLRVDMKTPSGDSQTIWMEKNGRMTRLVHNGSDGRERYQVRYEDYEQGKTLAGKITIQMADYLTSVSVQFTDAKIEKAGDPSVFDLTAPDGTKIIPLD